MKTIILILPIKTFDRQTAEYIENKTYQSIQDIPIGDGHNYYELTDFMDLVNNQEFKEKKYWISYVNIINL